MGFPLVKRRRKEARMSVLLTRDAFREAVFARDRSRCVLCGEPARDAHHILERRLFPDGGYYLDNGVSVCGPCHMACEQTLESCDGLRRAAGIETVVLPPHLYRDVVYDKWGNIWADGVGMRRLPGELFYDESVQKVLAPVLHYFVNRVKYPRTFHFPWSPGRTKDDRILTDLSGFEGEEVVVTAKMDGENTTVYRDGLHARSVSPMDSHPSRDRLKALHASIQGDIPRGWRCVLENVFAKHSIHYRHLATWFFLISIWKEGNVCLSWDETVEWAGLLGLETVPVLWRGAWDEVAVRGLWRPEVNSDPCEGYVVRVTREFGYGEFRRVVGKYVREGHVDEAAHHWKYQKVVPNELAARGGGDDG